MRECGHLVGIQHVEKTNPSATLEKPLPNQEQKQEQEQEQEGVPPSPVANAPGESPPDAGDQSTVTGKGATTFKTWLAKLKASGEKAISDYKPIWEYAKRVGIPDDWVQMAWVQFRQRYERDEKASRKRYKDWRLVFLNAVEGNWLRLWAWSDREGGYVLSTVGKQADIATREVA